MYERMLFSSVTNDHLVFVTWTGYDVCAYWQWL